MDDSSYSRQQLDDLFLKMIAYYAGDPKRIHHDIGIKPAEEKYGSSDGKLQEQEGPIVAQKMLSELGFENYIIDRICYLIGHHHTYDNVEGLDYQVLIEADFLVNLYEDDINRNGIESAYKNIFRTDTGKRIFEEMFFGESEKS